jgi:predicted amidohydrolase YtcJ
MRRCPLLGIWGILAMPAFAASLAESAAKVDLVVVGRIATLDQAQPWAEAVAVSGDRIVYVGARAGLPEAARSARTIDADGGVVLPGLVDAHAHLLGLATALRGLDLTGTRSYDEILEKVRSRDSELPAGRWLQGRGWDQNDWGDKNFPHRKRLDLVCPSRPVVLERVDGHAVLVNGVVLAQARIDRGTPDPPGGKILRDDSGDPTGVLVDNAMGLVKIPEPTLEERIEGLSDATRLAVQAGLTGVHDMGNDSTTLEAFTQMANQGRLPIRVYALAAGGSSAQEDLMRSGPRVGLGLGGRLTIRAVKFYADGALGSRGAALEEPYSDDPGNRGLLLTQPDELCRQMERVSGAGLQVAVHAIGDRGNRIVLDCVERLATAGHPAARPRLEHAQVLRLEDIPRVARLGVVASMQPTHATSDMPWAETRVGPQRIRGAYAWKTLLAAGARLAFGSDFPVESHDPLLGLYAAITRQDRDGHPEGGWYPGEKLDVTQAVEAFTQGAAFAAFEESDLGSIQTGKLADLTVLDVDPWKVEPRQLLNAHVRWTIVGGRIEYERAR